MHFLLILPKKSDNEKKENVSSRDERMVPFFVFSVWIEEEMQFPIAQRTHLFQVRFSNQMDFNLEVLFN